MMDKMMNEVELFGQQITNLRKKRGISIRDLAARCEIAPSTIVRIQAGLFSPRLDIIQRILHELNAELIIKDK